MDDHLNSLSKCNWYQPIIKQPKCIYVRTTVSEIDGVCKWNEKQILGANCSDHKHPIASTFHGNECNPKCFGIIFPSFSQLKNNVKVNILISCISLDLFLTWWAMGAKGEQSKPYKMCNCCISHIDKKTYSFPII